ncbi:hypothetical protein GGX14DRAFT_442802 [Mycena pura]|uniref:Uncharacterized protein n=1 Tax=Mycena pura TaxID=153505 RepID=A0AAD6YI37_9AGAR|nr:hypothetical protein GGX14DRAFT_442802 [Mycena pura]
MLALGLRMTLFASALLWQLQPGYAVPTTGGHLMPRWLPVWTKASNDDNTTTPCDSLCNPLVDSLFDFVSPKNETACTDSFVQQSAQCLDCSDKYDAATAQPADPTEAAESQQILNDFVSNCTANGHAVKNATVAGAFKGAFNASGALLPSSGGRESVNWRVLAAMTLGVFGAGMADFVL